MSQQIRRGLKTGKCGKSWTDLVDYSITDLKLHLESQFNNEYSWDTYGKGFKKWNTDHIIPVSSFNITGPYCDDFKECWSLKNLQPLWEIDNLKKSDLMSDGSRGRDKLKI